MSNPSGVHFSFDVTVEPLEGWNDFIRKVFGLAKPTKPTRRRIRANHVIITAGRRRYRRRYERIRRQRT